MNQYSQYGDVSFNDQMHLMHDDISEGSDDSQFETEPLESSSSEDERRSLARLMSSGHVYRRQPASSVSDESSVDELNVSDEPNWFVNGPFKYNGRVAMLALPGFLLVLLFSGETFLGLAAVGSLVVCLLLTSGNRKRAMGAYIIMLVMVQLSVIYSVLPLIWTFGRPYVVQLCAALHVCTELSFSISSKIRKSIFNFFIIFALNTYTFLTGGWLLLQFDNFRFQEPDVVMLLETSLFTIYPASFVIQITWLMAVLTSVAVSPYVFMLLGFIVLQVFTTPAQSSFMKPHAQGSLAIWDSEGYILSPDVTALVAIMYSICSPTLLFLLRAAAGWKALISLSTVVQFVFLSSSSVFLASFLHLRMFIEKSGVSHSFVIITRWSALVVSLILFGPLLHSYNVKSTLLPWIPAVTFVFIGLILATLRRHKVGTDISLALISLVIVGMFYQLPWHLDFSFAKNSVSLSFVQTCLLMNAAVCLLALRGAACWSSDALGLVLLVQSLLFSALSRVMLSDGHIWSGLIIAFGLLYIYVCLRLYHSGRVPYQSSLLLNSVHAASMVTTLGHIYGSEADYYGIAGQAFNLVSTFALAYVVLRLVIYQDTQINEISVLVKHLLVLCCSLVINVPILLTDILQFISPETDLAASAFLGLIGVMMTLVFGKLISFNGCPSIKHSFSLLTIAAVPSLTLLILRPQVSFERDELQKWAALVSVVCAASIVPLAVVFGTHLHIIGVSMGLPLGVGLLHTLLPGLPSLAGQVMFGLLAVLCLLFLLTAWQQSRNANHWLKAIALWIGVCAIIISTVINDSLVAIVVPLFSSLLIAVVLRLYLSKPQVNLDQSGASVDYLPVVGNFYTTISVLLLSLCCPVRFKFVWYLWVCATCPLFLLLNKDNFLLRTLCARNKMAPVMSGVAITLYAAAFIDCGLLSAGSRILSLLVGFLELLTLIASTPVAVSLLTTLWSGSSIPSSVLVVFTAPAFLVLFLFGAQYSSWVLAMCGIVTSYWLMKYKLVFNDDD